MNNDIDIGFKKETETETETEINSNQAQILFPENIKFCESYNDSQSTNSVFCSPIDKTNNTSNQNSLFVNLMSDMCVEKCNVLLESIKEIDKNNNFTDDLSIDDIENIVATYDFDKLKNLSLDLYDALSQIKELQFDLEKNTNNQSANGQETEMKNEINDEKKRFVKKLFRRKSFFSNNENICEKNIGNYTLLHKKSNTRGTNNKGDTYLSIDKKTNRKYEIRIIPSPNFILHKTSYNLLLSTVENMKYIDYENVLKLHDVIEDKKEKIIYLITRNIEEKSFLTLSASEPNRKFVQLQMDKVIDYTRQIINGLQALHSQNIIYSNLGLNNIILDNNDKIYLTEFWINNIVNNKHTISNKYKIDVLLFTPPELLSKSYSPGFYNNVWSLGVIIFVMIFGYYPFYSDKYEELKDKILYKNPDYPKNITEMQQNFFKKIFNKDPHLRIILPQILRHDLFEGNKKLSNSFSFDNNSPQIFIAKPPSFRKTLSSKSLDSFKRKLSLVSFENNDEENDINIANFKKSTPLNIINIPQ